MDNKPKISLLYGGRSGEHEVSLRSAAAVYRHLDSVKYDPVLIGISKEGLWYRQDLPDGTPEALTIDEDPDRLISLIPGDGLYVGAKKLFIDLALPVLHGTFGEDGTLQGVFEILQIPYAGSGVLGSASGMDKVRTKQIWDYHGLSVVPYIVVRKNETAGKSAESDKKLDEAFRRFGPPLFVKPSGAGSSLGVIKIEHREECAAALQEAFCYDRTVLIEKGVAGKEVECAVLGGPRVEVSIPGEIIPKHSFYDYKSKYVDPDGADLRIPADLSDALTAEVRRIAAEAFSLVAEEGFARVDFFIEKGTDTIYLNEINTIPGFTSISMFPMLFLAAGKSFNELVEDIIQAAFGRAEQLKEIRYTYNPHQ